MAHAPAQGIGGIDGQIARGPGTSAEIPAGGAEAAAEPFANGFAGDDARGVAAAKRTVEKYRKAVDQPVDAAMKLHRVGAAVGELEQRGQRWDEPAAEQDLIDRARQVAR